MKLNNEDIKKIEEGIETMIEMRERGLKVKTDITLSSGTKVTVYHMGQTNKTIRIDINA